MGNGADEDIRQMNEIVERARAVDEHGHGLCPACGRTASLDVLIMGPELRPVAWAPRCDTCGLTWPTGKTITPAAWEAWERLSEDARNAIADKAWEAWDRAWWRGGR